MASEPVEGLNKHDIIQAAKDRVLRRKAAKWTVVVDGEEFAARPLVLAAAGVAPNDPTNSHQAIAKLKKLGFETRYEGKSDTTDESAGFSGPQRGSDNMSRAGKYAPLNAFLAAQTALPLTLSFRQVEVVLGFELPRSAITRLEWWGNEEPTSTRHVQSLAWTTAGLKASPDLVDQNVTFSD